MLCCDVILLSALCLVLGQLPSSVSQHYGDEDNLEPFQTFNTPSPEPTSSTPTDVDETDDEEVIGVCLLGSIPTATCMVKCFWKNKSVYCDEEANCRCGTNNVKDDVDGSYRASHEDVTTIQPDLDTEEGVMGVCFFGHIPSPSCMFRCSVRGQSSVCDEESRCSCENRTFTDLLTPNHSMEKFEELAKNESESDDDGSVVFLILDLGGLFESEDTPQEEEPKDSFISHELWTLPHIVTMAVLTLVAILLILELTLCCKRHYRQPCKQPLQTVLSSEVLEKGMINEKHP